jgi:hypothetical protein
MDYIPKPSKSGGSCKYIENCENHDVNGEMHVEHQDNHENTNSNYEGNK